MCGGNGKFASEKRSFDIGVFLRRFIVVGVGRSCRGVYRVILGFAVSVRFLLKKCIL